MINIHIVEESALGRAGLEELLRGPGIEILSSVASVAELEDRFAEDLAAGIVVAAGEPAQLAATQEQLAASDLFHGLPVVVFMEVDERSFDTLAAIRMGARAVYPRNFLGDGFSQPSKRSRKALLSPLRSQVPFSPLLRRRLNCRLCWNR